MSVMGGLAVILSAMGVFSVVAYTAAERQKEVAIRMAFGASVRSVVWTVLRQGMSLTCAGILTGTVAAVLCCHLLFRKSRNRRRSCARRQGCSWRWWRFPRALFSRGGRRWPIGNSRSTIRRFGAGFRSMRRFSIRKFAGNGRVSLWSGARLLASV